MPSPLHGPPPALPASLDRLADRWARLPPRVRVVVWVVVVLAVGALQAGRLAETRSAWGGAGQDVWRATATVPAGEALDGRVERIRLPAAAIPPGAVGRPPDDAAPLALALVEGAVLTDVHLSPVGPAVALPADQRAVPVPVDAAWGVEAGALVDVWAVTGRDAAPARLAEARPVLQVSTDGPRPTALVGLHADDVPAATTALAGGRILLTLRGGAPP